MAAQPRSGVIAATLVLATQAGVASGQMSFRGLGVIDDQTRATYVTGISGDGRVVVGYANYGEGGDHTQAFLWTAERGMVGLGFLPGGSADSEARGVSGDGSVVVGTAGFPPGHQAFLWTPAFGPVELGRRPVETSTEALGVSADGGVVVGTSLEVSSGQPRWRAFRWTPAGGPVGLGIPASGDPTSIARATSADGSVVVGDAGGQPVLWTADGTMSSLGPLSGGTAFGGWAADVSDDGTVVVGSVVYGRSDDEWIDRPFRWTADRGMIGLGLLSPYISGRALATNADGSVVVGTADDEDIEATLWTEHLGTVELKALLLAGGATDVLGWNLNRATAISADGRTIAGWGIDPSGRDAGWVAVVPEPTAAVPLATATTAALLRRARRKPSRVTSAPVMRTGATERSA